MRGSSVFSDRSKIALAQRQLRPDAKFASEHAKRLAVDETGSHARQISFGHGGISPEQFSGNHAVQHSVSEKFKPLIVC